MTGFRDDRLVHVEEDGLLAEDVGAWSAEKYRRLRMYAEMFSTGMKNKCDCRTYVDLFAGSGHATVRESRERVLSSPLLALSVKDPFDKYVFCERDKGKLDALMTRVRSVRPNADVSAICGDVNKVMPDLEAAIPKPTPTTRALTFCFIDPYGLHIHFETVKKLALDRKMDVLVLLASHMDANRNWTTYTANGSRHLDRFFGDASWRGRWNLAKQNGEKPVRFLAEEYQRAMTRIGYTEPGLNRMFQVRYPGNNMRLYYLAFFSKHPRGYQFWDEVLKYSSDQLGLL